FVTSLFFFSSRRRHTRFSRDWSSDVCSSDLDFLNLFPILFNQEDPVAFFCKVFDKIQAYLSSTNYNYKHYATSIFNNLIFSKSRSEERRVGKECRYRMSPHQQKK